MAGWFRRLLENSGFVCDFRAPRAIADGAANALDLPWLAIEPVWHFLYPDGDGDRTAARVKRVTAGQLAIFTTWWLDSEVCNGGFSQYYENGSGHYAAEALHGLELIGASEFSELHRQSMRIFPGSNPPKRRTERVAALYRAFGQSPDDEKGPNRESKAGKFLDALESRYYKLLERDGDLLRRYQAAYVRSHLDEFFR